MKQDPMFLRFGLYGFLKNLRFFDPFLLLILLEAGLSYFQIGLLYAVRELTTVVLEIPTGVYADAFGRRKSMIFAFLAYIVSFVVFYAFNDFFVYALAMVCFGVGEAFRSGTHKALILEHLKRNGMEDLKVSYYGRTRAASQLGSAVNALLAAALVFYTGEYRMMFLAAVLPYTLNLINLLGYPQTLDGALTSVRKGEVPARMMATLHAFFDLFKSPSALRAIANSAGFTASFKSSKDYLQPILQAFAFSLPVLAAWDADQRAAVIIGVAYFIIFLLTSYASRNADRFGQRFADLGRAINLTFLLGAGLLLVAGWAVWHDRALLAIVVFVGLYVLHNLRRPLNVALISDRVARRVMASGFSAESQAVTLLMALLAPLLGLAADQFGVGAALAGLGGGLLFLFLFVRVRVERQESDPSG